MRPERFFPACLAFALTVIGLAVAAPRAAAQAGSLQFSTSAYSVGESVSSALITVVRLGGSVGEVSVEFRTRWTGVSDATPDVDYIPTNGTLTFLPASRTIFLSAAPALRTAPLRMARESSFINEPGINPACKSPAASRCPSPI